MNKSDLIREVATRTGLKPRDVQKIFDTLFGNQKEKGIIIEALQNGLKVNISGFGAFEVRHRPPRKARNPRTGETIQVPARKSAAFRPGKRLKEALR